MTAVSGSCSKRPELLRAELVDRLVASISIARRRSAARLRVHRRRGRIAARCRPETLAPGRRPKIEGVGVAERSRR
jgi:hypothetical protein